MQIEVTNPLHLDARQEAQVDFHSFLNLVNVLSSDLVLLQDDLGWPAFAATLETCYALSESFQEEPSAPLILVQALLIRDQLRAETERLLASKHQALEQAEIREQVENLVSLREVLDVRYGEMQVRGDDPLKWGSYTADELRASLQQFLGAVEKNAMGRYQIVTNPARMAPLDYLVHLDFSTQSPDQRIHMPAILRDVARDLTANARKYTEPGGTIEVGIHQGDEFVTLVVRDNGRGIPEAELGQIVEFGFRGSNVGADETKGGGFGLTKAYWVTRNFLGRMWVESVLGKSTCITIQIPLVAQPTPALAPPSVPPVASSPSPARETPETGNALRVGVLDDNATVRMATSRMLARAGYAAREFASSAELLEALGKEHLDLVLLDMTLGDGDGLTVARSIRALPEPLCRLPLIAATGHTSAEKRAAFLAGGLDDYLPKPIRSEDLVEKVERWARPAVDLTILNDATSGDSAFEKELVSAFLKEGGELLERLGGGISLSALHTLKGLAQTVGALGLATLVDRQESAPPNQSLEPLKSEFARVRKFFAARD